jgi:hypothetical protein
MAKVETIKPIKAKGLAKIYGTTAKKIRELNNLKVGQTIKPGSIVKLGKGVGGSAQGVADYVAPPSAQMLYVDPAPAYAPILSYLNQQASSASDRYKINKESIKNIFGDLASIAEKDAVRIEDQFKRSIAEQQQSLAARTAEARTAQSAGEAQAAETATERGAGPEMAGSPTATATEEGIARSNEYATTWQALQNATQQQMQADISARGAGYGQQEVGAIQQLAQSLEDRLLAIGGNTAQVQADIAAARISGQQQVAQASYGQLQQDAAMKAQMQVAKAAGAGGGSGTTAKTSTGASGSKKAVLSFVNTKFGTKAKNTVAQQLDDINAGGYKSWQQAMTAFRNKYGSQWKTGVETKVEEYFRKNYSVTQPTVGTTKYTKDIFGFKQRILDGGYSEGDYNKFMKPIRQAERTKGVNDAASALTAWREAYGKAFGTKDSSGKITPAKPPAEARDYASYYFNNIWSK